MQARTLDTKRVSGCLGIVGVLSRPAVELRNEVGVAVDAKLTLLMIDILINVREVYDPYHVAHLKFLCWRSSL
jgi:hypothetical protein